MRLLVAATGLTSASRDAERVTAYVAIDAVTLWTQFSRSYYLATVMGARDASGNRPLAPSSRRRTVQEALTPAVVALNPKWANAGPPWKPQHEPDWKVPTQFVKALAAVGAANQQPVSAALSFGAKAFGDLPTCRNHFAHKDEATARKVLNLRAKYRLPPQLERPTQVLLARSPGRPQSVLLDWLDELRTATVLLQSV